MERIVKKMPPSAPVIPKKLRVAAYARVSTGKEAMVHSLSAQVSYYSEMIQNHHGWLYCGVYADYAVTGTKQERPEFQRMLADCRAGKIDMILTKSISRFARNSVDLLETVRELKNLGIDCYFEKENIHCISGDGELLLSILASFAQEESLSVSENCAWRIRNKYKDGIPNTFTILGYDVKKGVLTVNPEEAKIVKMIFSDYLSGMGKTAIVKKLHESRVRPKLNGEWDSRKIHDILCNEKYIGDLLMQKGYISDHLTKKNRKNKGELPQYLVKDNHEPIIYRDTFEKAQREMARRAGQYYPRSDITAKYPFTGKIECGICGKHYRRKINNSGTKYERVIWVCSTYNTLGKSHCASRQIPESTLQCLTDGLKVHSMVAYPDKTLKIILEDNTELMREWE